MSRDEKFVEEFKRITQKFQAASRELNKTSILRVFKTKKLFKQMQQANLEMEMLGNQAKASALRKR